MSTSRNLRLEVLLQAVDRVTRPFKAVIDSSSQLAKTVKAARDQIKTLESAQKKLADFRELKRGLKESSFAMRNARDHAAALRQRLEKLEAPMRQKADATARLKKATAAYQANIKTIEAMQRAGVKGSEAYEKLVSAQLRARTEVKRLTEEQKAAARQVPQTAAQYRALQREYETSAKRAQQLRDAHGASLSKLRDMRGQLSAAGIRTKELGQRQRELAGQLAGANQHLQRQQALLRAVADRQRSLAAAQTQYHQGLARRNAMMNAGMSATIGGAAVLAPVAKSVKDYVTFEDAMLGIARQVEGARDEGGRLTTVYHDMARQIRQLGRELPVPVAQIADMVTAGARMEVPREGLIEYTRAVAMMATAFDAVPDEIAESMGKVAKNFRIPTNEIMGLADTINYLDDNAISKGSDIINVLNRTSGVVSGLAMSARDSAALASTLLTLGERAETAGTAINSITQKFAAAEKGTAKFRSAVEEIGLSAAEIQRGMATDATGTMFKVIDAIRRLPSEKRIGVMVELAGMEHSDTLAKLVDKPDEFRRQLDLANGSKAEGSMSREFAARQDTISARWQRLQNQLFNTSSAGGEVLRGTLVDLMETVGSLADRFNAFAEANPRLVGWLIKGAAFVGVLLTAFGALTLALAAALGPIVMVKYGMSLLGIQMAGRNVAAVSRLGMAFNTFKAVMLKVGLVMMANPIVLVIMAIAVAVGLLIWYWKPISAFFVGLWERIRGAFSGGIGNVTAFILNWSPYGLFYSIFARVLSWFGIDMPEKFTDFGANLLKGLIKGVTSLLPKVRETIGSIGDSVVGWFKEKLGIRSPSRVFARLGGFTMEGLDQGLEDGQGGPLGTMARVAKVMTGLGAGISFAAAAPAIAGVTFDKRPPLAASSPAGMGVGMAPAPIIINVYPPAGTNEQTIARMVATEIQRVEARQKARARSRLTDQD